MEWGCGPDPKPSSSPTGFPSFCKHPGPLISPNHSAPPFLLPSRFYLICLHILLQDSHMNLLAFLKHEGHHSASGPLYLLFPLPGTVCPPFHSCTSLRSVLKCQLFSENFPDIRLKLQPPCPSWRLHSFPTLLCFPPQNSAPPITH